MKFLALTFFVSMSVVAAPTVQKKTTTTTTVTKETKPTQGDKAKAALGKKEEDCDDKAKKPVEIKAETLSLGGGNAGCTLE